MCDGDKFACLVLVRSPAQGVSVELLIRFYFIGFLVYSAIIIETCVLQVPMYLERSSCLFLDTAVNPVLGQAPEKSVSIILFRYRYYML